MLDLIEKAVHGRNILTFRYDGKNRFVEPHAVGLTSKGKAVFRGYQPAGDTNTETGWKLFTIEKCEDLTVLPLTFDFAREGYVLGDKYIPNLMAQVDAVFA